MRIIVYCQHVLGVGHFFRSLELCRALSRHDVFFVTGGVQMDLPLPAHVTRIPLPELMMQGDFTHLAPARDGVSLEDVKKRRREMLRKVIQDTTPQVLVVEFYPFGRKAFRFEIDPVLEGIRTGTLPRCRVVSSTRDILVEKENGQKHEERVVRTLNGLFDAVLIHADPAVIDLSATFSRIEDIVIPLVYTGYVASKPTPDARSRLRRQLGVGEGETLVVASVGGGRVGHVLLDAVVRAFRALGKKRDAFLQVFTGPLFPEDALGRLEKEAGPRTRVQRFTPDLPSYLSAADLSVSMAGYNTCMDVLAARVPALVWPFAQNREQRLRAERLARLDAVCVLNDADLSPRRLAAIMDAVVSRASRMQVRVDLDGAAASARWLASWVGNSER